MKAEEFLQQHPDPDSLFQGTDRDKFMHKAICGVMEAYHQSEVNTISDETLEFLNMILNSYKVINKESDYQRILNAIVFKAENLKNKLLKQ